jgi:hypothetical protein
MAQIRQGGAVMARYGSEFDGLTADEFDTNVTGTTWRSRDNLGGYVAGQLSRDTPYRFRSGAVSRWPVVYISHRDDIRIDHLDDAVRIAKFFLEIDEGCLTYGYCIEKGDGDLDGWDWSRLLAGLWTGGRLRKAIERIEDEHGARFLARKSQGDPVHFADGPDGAAEPLWDEAHPSWIDVQERVERLSGVPHDWCCEVYIVKQMSKQQAVDAGMAVADPITDLMKALMPLYTASV